MIDILSVEWGVVIYFQSYTQSWILKNNAPNIRQNKRIRPACTECSVHWWNYIWQSLEKTSDFITDLSVSSCLLNFHAVQYSGGFFRPTLGLFPCDANEAFTPDPWQSWMVFASIEIHIINNVDRQHLFFSNFQWTRRVVNISANMQIVSALLALLLSKVE